MATTDRLGERLLLLLARHGPTRSRELAALAREPAQQVRTALAALRRRDLVSQYAGRWSVPQPGHEAWPRVDQILHGRQADNHSIPNRRPRAGIPERPQR